MITFLAFLLMVNQPIKPDSIVLGGGCFWCTEAIYKNVKGVTEVTPGYTGGETRNPTYQDICSGETGHAEVVKVEFDPAIVSLSTILTIFFETHDPTSLNKQGADVGTQYRSAIFYSTLVQKEIILEKIKQINKQKKYKKEIVTEVVPLTTFYKAEDYHFNYYDRNSNQPYCRFIINPKIEKFKKLFPENKK
jgi:methionine-S-sulfoxide reductase